ncbi:hypothetical protein [Nocardia sp. CC201C]|uniref:hypothetical protein n=1 Tax=Nocardia sp. CC201C TaxID=3044575 RepID=UPI0024A93FC6|nr:hypothetical protein [Nocardia sp. CC201C]
MGLMDSVQPFTVRIFGNDLLAFQDYIQILKRRLDRISIAESEAINAAIIRVNILANDELREREMDELNLNAEQRKEFINWANWFMERFDQDVSNVIERRENVDKRRVRGKVAE